MLLIKDLSFPGLAPVGLAVGTGECLAVTGPSGAGKSRLLRAIADLDPNAGEVVAAGMVRAEVPAPIWRRAVAYVAAESGWWAETVGAHFQQADAPALGDLLSALRLPAECLDWPISRLSTGERQRLALIRTLITAPPVLLLDEPTAALDQADRAAVERLLHERLERGVTIVMVSHDPEQAKRLAARVLRITDGVARMSG